MPPSTCYRTLGVSSPFDHPDNAFVSSPVLSASLLAAIRLAFAIYTLTALVTSLAWDSLREHTGNTFFSAFTWLSYTGLCAYFWASGVQTWAWAWANTRTRRRRRRKRSGYPLQQWPRFLQFLHVLLFSTVTTYPILVTIVYWAELFPQGGFASRFSAWSGISAHALNTAFTLFELVFTNTPPAPWIHLSFLIVMLGGYLGIAYISHMRTGIYPYNFLDPKKEGPWLAGWIVGIALATCILFTIMRFLWMLRVRLASRCAAAAGENDLDVRAGSMEALDEWNEVGISLPVSSSMS